MKNALLALCALGLFVPVMAEDYKLPKKDPVFTVEIPEEWTVTHSGETIDAFSGDEAIQLWLTVDDAATLDDSVEVAMDYLVESGVEIDADSQEDNKGEITRRDVPLCFVKGQRDFTTRRMHSDYCPDRPLMSKSAVSMKEES